MAFKHLWYALQLLYLAHAGSHCDFEFNELLLELYHFQVGYLNFLHAELLDFKLVHNFFLTLSPLSDHFFLVIIDLHHQLILVRGYFLQLLILFD